MNNCIFILFYWETISPITRNHYISVFLKKVNLRFVESGTGLIVDIMQIKAEFGQNKHRTVPDLLIYPAFSQVLLKVSHKNVWKVIFLRVF